MPPSFDAKIQLRRSSTVSIPSTIANGEPVFCDTNGVMFLGVDNEPIIVAVKCGLSRRAIEEIVAGDMVSFGLEAGESVARLADASNGYLCHGYAVADAAVGEQARVATAHGSILAVSRPGGDYFLGSQGAIVSNAPANNSQLIGNVVGGVLIFSPANAFT